MKTLRGRWRGLFLIAFALLISALLIYFQDFIKGLGKYGYAGGFFMGMLSSATVFVPIPGILVTFLLGGILQHPWLLGMVVGLGEALGELTGYGMGRGGRMLIKGRSNPRPSHSRLESWMRRRGGLVIFLMASIPNPIFDLVGTIAGVLGYPLWRFLVLCWLGKAIKSTGIALAGYWGLKFVLDWLGMLKVQ